MIKINKSLQIMISLAILVIGIFLFLYFFRQMATTGNNFAEVEVSQGHQNNKVNNENTDINLKIFSSEKFINLKSEAAPAQNFTSGKRNPFEPF